MSKSFKKHPILGICADSEKIDKQDFSRGFRTETTAMLNKKQYDILPDRKNPKHGGNWNFRKDGKVFLKEKVTK